MATSEHKTRIEIKIDDQEARASIDYIVSQLEKAQELAGNLALSFGGGGGPGGGAGGGAGGGGGGTSSTSGKGGDKEEKEEKDKKPEVSRKTTAFLYGAGGAASALAKGNPTAAVEALTEGIRGVGKAFDKVAEAHVSVAGFQIPVGAIAALPIAFGEAVMAGINMRLNHASRIAQTEAGRSAFMGSTGLGDPGYSAGTGFGFMPSESASIMGAMGPLTGGALKSTGDLLKNYNPFMQIRRGEDPGLGPALLGMTMQGGGATGNLSNIAGIRGGFARAGLSGANLDKIMGGFIGLADSLRDNGASLNLNSLEIAANSKAMQAMGVRAGAVTRNIAQTGTGAANNMLAPFKKIFEGQLIADAFSGGRSLTEAIQYMRDISGDPNRSMGMLRGMDPIIGMSMGMSLDEAMGVSGQDPDGREYTPGDPNLGRRRTRSRSGMTVGFSAAFAANQVALMNRVGRDGVGPIKELLDVTKNLQIIIMKFSKSSDGLTSTMNSVLEVMIDLMDTLGASKKKAESAKTKREAKLAGKKSTSLPKESARMKMEQ